MNKYNISAVAYFAAAWAGLAASVGAVFLGLGILLLLGAVFSGWCFYLGLIHTAKSFSLIKLEKEQEGKTWKPKPS
jgi:hypothetical protein